jgi:hypothetical protein
MDGFDKHNIDLSEIAFSPLDFKPEVSFGQADHLYAGSNDRILTSLQYV